MQHDEARMTNDEPRLTNGQTTDDQRPSNPPPLQFGIRALLGMMVAVGLIFGTLRWIGASQQTGFLVLGILVASLLAAVGLIVAIARIDGDE